MRFGAAIFDLDGTLLDSLRDIAEAANAVLVELHRPIHPISDYRFFVGDGVSMLFQRVLPECESDPTLKQRCMSLFEKEYSTRWNIHSKPYDGMTDLLLYVQQSGLKIGILSNKPDSFTRRCASFFFPEVPFDLVVGHSERFPRKPDPSSAAWMAQQFDVGSDRIAYVGDTNTDMKTAVQAGFYAIGVTWGFRPETELREFGADQVVATAMELETLLLS
ncbi:MAG: HAD family hydrolase [Planctomycetes bacterium]|nr:HAD family hydrolase [Planctomycetota bacterium]